MEKEGNQLFISAEIFRWSFIEIDQAQEFPQNGREMSNKHTWKYNHSPVAFCLYGSGPLLVALLAEENWEEAKLYALFKGRLQTRLNNAVVH